METNDMATIDEVIEELQEMKNQKGNTGETRIIPCIFKKEDFKISPEEWDEYMESYSFVGPGVEPHLHMDIRYKISEHIKEHVTMVSKYREQQKEYREQQKGRRKGGSRSQE
jgi:hypothetical protein